MEQLDRFYDWAEQVSKADMLAWHSENSDESLIGHDGMLLPDWQERIAEVWISARGE